jgi:type VI secretion system protein ImpG
MRDQLLPYYERELRYIRRLAGEFAERYPAVAGALLLEPDKCEDPHVERLIEAFALLTSRIRRRLDDEFPEITDSFLSMVAPQLLAPVPSITIVRFELDPEWSRERKGLAVPTGTLLNTRPVEGVRCRFRTAAPITLWPLDVSRVDAISLAEGESGSPEGVRGAIRIELKTRGGRPFSKVAPDELRFFLDGDAGTAHRLYETLFRDPRGVLLRAPGQEAVAPRRLPVEGTLEPGGFSDEEALLPSPAGVSSPHRILQEYFAFPDKFLFAKFGGLAEWAGRLESDRMEILVLLDHVPLDLQGALGVENLKLGCAPAVNLFSHQTDPIHMRRTQVEYPVTPDMHAVSAYEVWAIEEVSSTSPRTGETRDYRPFYSLRHGEADDGQVAFWHASRRPSDRKGDRGTEVTVSLVDRGFDPSDGEGGEVLSVRALCTNRDLPARLPLGKTEADFQLEGKPSVRAVRCLRKPTEVIRPSSREEGRWKLVSHLSLNFLSISEVGGEDPATGGRSRALEAFREILRLHDFGESAVTRARIEGLVGVEARPVLRRVHVHGQSIHARGLEVRLAFDEDKFAGHGAFLFASVLERFLGLYTSLNSFVQTVAVARQREGVLKKWSPRAGDRPLL